MYLISLQRGIYCMNSMKEVLSKIRFIFHKNKYLSDHLLRHKLAMVCRYFFYSYHSTGILALWSGLPIFTLYELISL